MSVGYQVSKTEIDTTSGTLCRMINSWATDVIRFQENFLAGATDTELEGMGYTPDDVALLKSAIGDLYKLAHVFQGLVDSTPAYDYRTFSSRLTGTVL